MMTMLLIVVGLSRSVGTSERSCHDFICLNVDTLVSVVVVHEITLFMLCVRHRVVVFR